MFRFYFIILSPVFCFFHHQNNIQKIWLFSQTQYGGNVPVNKNGHQVKNYSTKLLCFIETGKNLQVPMWQTASINGNKYSVNILKVDQDSVLVGIRINTHSPIILKTNPDSKLVQLELTLVEGYKKSNKANFVLVGVLNKKHVSFQSNEPVIELSPLLMP